MSNATNPSSKARGIKKRKRKKGVHWHTKMLPIIRNLTSLGLNEAEIGLIFGYSGKDPRQWLNNIKKVHPEIVEPWKMGKKAALMEAVGTLWLESTGYDYDEIHEESSLRVDREGNPVLDENGKKQYDIVKKKKVTKHARPDPSLLKYLLSTQLPQYFKETKDININSKHLSLEAKAQMNKEEIEEFAGKLLEIANDSETTKKMVEEDIIEAEFEIEDE